MRRLLMDTETLLQDDDDVAAGEAAEERGERESFPSEPVAKETFPSEPSPIYTPKDDSALHVAGRTLGGGDLSKAYSSTSRGKGSSKDVSFEEEEVLNPLGAVGAGLGSLLNLGQGMMTGVREISYNTYTALVIGRQGRNPYR